MTQVLGVSSSALELHNQCPDRIPVPVLARLESR